LQTITVAVTFEKAGANVDLYMSRRGGVGGWTCHNWGRFAYQNTDAIAGSEVELLWNYR
jgi:hypothetical protein